MAWMHPENIEGLESATPGEKAVFQFLREVPRPDSEFIGWYEPTIGEQGSETDFVLFGNQHGLLVLEVKDWLIDQIEKADSLNFKVWIGEREENKTNPDKQARGYVYGLMNVLKEIPDMDSERIPAIGGISERTTKWTFTLHGRSPGNRCGGLQFESGLWVHEGQIKTPIGRIR